MYIQMQESVWKATIWNAACLFVSQGDNVHSWCDTWTHLHEQFEVEMYVFQTLPMLG